MTSTQARQLRGFLQPRVGVPAEQQRKPRAVPQWLIDSELTRQLTPEGRQMLVASYQHLRDHGVLMGDWVLPEV